MTSFKGIPYAAAPFGPNRFRPPQHVEPWDGVRDAAVFGATAPMPGYLPPYERLLPNPIIEGDACLNLNVWTPDPGARGLPVMVWVHGGAFVNGSSAVPLYDGTGFARDGIVHVSVNYRLGVDGFLDLADGKEAAANRGLLDQIAALEWVQANIEAFGGDPGRVTVFGESAGAMSIGALLSSPRSEGLFARAILQSGAGHHAVTPATAALVRGELARRLGVPATREALADVPLERLVAAQAALTLEAQQTPDRARWGEIALNSMAFEPVVDGDLVPDLPARGIAAGAAPGVEVLLGTTAEEHRLFLVPNGIADAATEPMLAGLAAAYGLDVEIALGTYRARRPDVPPGYVLADVMSDWFFRIPAIRLAEARAAHGLPVWAYEFAWSSPAYDGWLGSCHALEIGFVFDTLDHPWPRCRGRPHRMPSRTRSTAPGSPSPRTANLVGRRMRPSAAAPCASPFRPRRLYATRGARNGASGTGGASCTRQTRARNFRAASSSISARLLRGPNRTSASDRPRSKREPPSPWAAEVG